MTTKANLLAFPAPDLTAGSAGFDLTLKSTLNLVVTVWIKILKYFICLFVS